MHFAAAPELTAAAPGRVNLLGGHIDYHGGTVFPLAIDRYTVVCGRRTEKGIAKFVSIDGSPAESSDTRSARSTVLSQIELDLTQALTPESATKLSGEGAAHLCGVLAGFGIEGNMPLHGMEICVCSNVPIGGGLSSSAALQVAFATCLQEWTGQQKTRQQIALLCQNAEKQFVGVPCGVMDQMTSVFGRAGQLLQIHCRDLQLKHHLWPDDLVVLLIDSGARHRLADGNYANTRQASETALEKIGVATYHELNHQQVQEHKTALSEIEFDAATHVLSEMKRCVHFESALDSGDWNMAGQQLFDSHDSLRDRYRVSCKPLDSIVSAAKSIGPEGGCFGARMTGGGFGGFVVAVVAKDRADEIQNRLHSVARLDPSYDPGPLPFLQTGPVQAARLV